MMNVEFNPNEGDNGVANGHSNDDDDQYEYTYGRPRRSYTYKDRPGSLRGDGYGGGGKGRYNPVTHKATSAIESHNYEPDESEVWRAYVAQVHFSNRGQWWTTGKKRSLKRWILTFAVGVVQAVVAAVCNFASRSMATRKYEYVYDLLNPVSEEETGSTSVDDLVADATGDDATSSVSALGNNKGSLLSAFWSFVMIQVLFCFAASIFVFIGKYNLCNATSMDIAYALANFNLFFNATQKQNLFRADPVFQKSNAI